MTSINRGDPSEGEGTHNNSMQRTALRAAADAERSAAREAVATASSETPPWTCLLQRKYVARARASRVRVDLSDGGISRPGGWGLRAPPTFAAIVMQVWR